MVDAEFAQAFDAVDWRCEEAIEEQAALLTPLAAETVYYATRDWCATRPGMLARRLPESIYT